MAGYELSTGEKLASLYGALKKHALKVGMNNLQDLGEFKNMKNVYVTPASHQLHPCLPLQAV